MSGGNRVPRRKLSSDEEEKSDEKKKTGKIAFGRGRRELSAGDERLASEHGIDTAVLLLTAGTDDLKIRALLQVLNFAVNPRHKQIVRDLGGLDTLIGLLSSENLAVQEGAAGALRNMSIDTEFASEFCAYGCVEAAVRVLSVGSTTGKARAAGVLWQLSVHDEVERRLLACGGVEALVSLLDSTNPEVQTESLGALAILASADESREAFRKAGGIAAVARAGRIPNEDLDLYVASTLLKSAGSRRCLDEIREVGGIDILIRLATHKDDVVAVDAVHGLRAVSEKCERNMTYMREKGGFTALVKVLSSRGVGETLKQVATYTIRELLTTLCDAEKLNMKAFREAGGIRALLRQLSINVHDIQSFSARSILALSCYEENRHEIVEAQGLQALIRTAAKGMCCSKSMAATALGHMTESQEYTDAICRMGGIRTIKKLATEETMQLYVAPLLWTLATKNSTNKDPTAAATAASTMVRLLASPTSPTDTHSHQYDDDEYDDEDRDSEEEDDSDDEDMDNWRLDVLSRMCCMAQEDASAGTIFRQAGALEPLTNILLYGPDAERIGAIALLYVMADDACCKAIADAGCIRPLVRMMAKEAHYPAVKGVIEILHRMARINPEYCDPICNAGGLPLLLRVLQYGPLDAKQALLPLLDIFCKDERVCYAVRDANGIRDIVNLASDPDTPAAITTSVSAVLFTLSLRPTCHEAIRQAGSIQILLNAISTDKDPQFYALLTLRNLSHESSNLEAILKARAISALLPLLHKREDIRQLVADTLANFAIHPIGRDAIRQAGGIEELLDVVETFPDESSSSAQVALVHLTSCHLPSFEM